MQKGSYILEVKPSMVVGGREVLGDCRPGCRFKIMVTHEWWGVQWSRVLNGFVEVMASSIFSGLITWFKTSLARNRGRGRMIGRIITSPRGDEKEIEIVDRKGCGRRRRNGRGK